MSRGPKLKDNCMDCGEPFTSVKRKVTHGKRDKRTNRCEFCWLVKSNESNLIRRKRWQVLKRTQIKRRGGCSSCGYDDLRYLRVFDYHHRNPKNKIVGIGQLMERGLTEKNQKLFITETEKCDILCKNCHAIIHERGV